MLTELASGEKVVGVKQSRKAIRDGRAARVFFACDADPALLDPVRALCEGLPAVEDYTMAQLGHACGIAVGAAVVAQLKE
ncbi:MAG: ribosomal L7Ae/L30e/S12e/Gadd45 family protein [Oscillibacter sp.]|nr:ribosomal L7Ae/L30e/S12e/Gadd45 family protein [Oscillibacter sp.]